MIKATNGYSAVSSNNAAAYQQGGGPEMGGVAAGAGAVRGCPRCGGVVFEAEKVVEKGLTYHKRCFRCATCNRPQDDKLQV